MSANVKLQMLPNNQIELLQAHEPAGVIAQNKVIIIFKWSIKS